MKNGLFKLKYMGISGESLAAYSDRISRDNLTILEYECIAIAAFGAVTAMLRLLFSGADSVFFLMLALFLLSTISYLIGTYFGKKCVGPITKKTNALIFAFTISLYILGSIPTFIERDSRSSLILCIVFVTHVSFALLPLRTMGTAILGISIFVIMDFMNKSFENAMHDTFMIVFCMLVASVVSLRQSKMKWEHEETLGAIAKSNTSLYYDSTTDMLTGIANRRITMDKLEVTVAKTSLTKGKMVCMIMDIDHFKRYNDSFGHPEGDKLLKGLGNILLDMQKKYEIPFSRIGGEEFMTFYEDTGELDPTVIAGEVIERIKKLPHPEEGKYTTISIGIYQGCVEEDTTATDIYIRADRALYEAKKNGRSRMEFYNIIND